MSDDDWFEIQNPDEPSPGSVATVKTVVDDVSHHHKECAYCYCDEESSLVKCMETGKYFCNGCTKGRGYSHIVMHLVKVRGTEVQLPDSEGPAKCYACQNTNIFRQYHIGVQGRNSILLCSDCLSKIRSGQIPISIRGMKLSPLDQAVKVVDGMKFTHELVDEPQHMPRNASKALTDHLENEWNVAVNPAYDVYDRKGRLLGEDWVPVKDKYSSVDEYSDVMERLIYSDMFHEQAACMHPDRCMQVTISWYQPPKQNAHVLGRFVATDFDFMRKVTVGETLQLDSKYCYDAVVIDVMPNGVIRVKVKTGGHKFDCDDEENINMTVRFKFNSHVYDSQLDALNEFAQECTGKNRSAATLVKDVWIGKTYDNAQVTEREEIKKSRIGGLKKLDPAQLTAVNTCLSRTFSIVEGPPGTGKTAVIASFVYWALRENSNAKILVCGPTNTVVMTLLESISYAVGSNVVGLLSKAFDDPDVGTQVFEHSIVNRMIFDKDLSGDSEATERLVALRRKESKRGYLTEPEEVEYKKIRSMLEMEICAQKSVICCTPAISATRAVSRCQFDYVIVDEATQMVEPLALIPIMKNIDTLTKVVLVGDYKQIGPTIPTSLKDTGYDMSKIERLIRCGMPTCKLDTQYRMHPSLIAFSSKYFYNGKIINGVTAVERSSIYGYKFPNSDHPMMFLDTVGIESRSSMTGSWINETEADNVCEIVASLYKTALKHYDDDGTRAQAVGIITPYGSQRELIMRKLSEYGPDLPESFTNKIVVSTVDAFQGSQRLYIIFSCVRTNRVTGIGFLKDQRRLNVALTRARIGLFIVGSIGALKRNRGWSDLLEEYSRLGLIFKGHLGDLEPVTLDDFHSREAQDGEE